MAQEASFLFDQSFSFWLFDIADQITDYLNFKEQNPYEKGPDGHGNTVVLGNERNVELEKAYALEKSRICKHFIPEERIERFWSYLHVTDQPLVS